MFLRVLIVIYKFKTFHVSFLTMLSALAPQLLFKPTPVCPLCLSRLCRFWWGSGRGAEELFVCAVRASSQEISGDGNSAETSCW